jgi:hypothetical protein
MTMKHIVLCNLDNSFSLEDPLTDDQGEHNNSLLKKVRKVFENDLQTIDICMNCESNEMDESECGLCYNCTIAARRSMVNRYGYQFAEDAIVLAAGGPTKEVSDDELLRCWVELEDESCDRNFFFNFGTGQSMWQYPEGYLEKIEHDKKRAVHMEHAKKKREREAKQAVLDARKAARTKRIAPAPA